MINKLLGIIGVFFLILPTIAHGQGDALKAALTKAEQELKTYLDGEKKQNTLNYFYTNHSVSYSWAPGSKRKVTIVCFSYYFNNNNRTDVKNEKYEIDLIQSENQYVMAGKVDNYATFRNFYIKTPVTKIKSTNLIHNTTTEVNEVHFKAPVSGAIPDRFGELMTNLSKAATAYWIWARDRG